MGKQEELSAKEQQNIFDDQKTWNLGRKKINNNGHKALTNQSETNCHIKKLQACFDDRKIASHNFLAQPLTLMRILSTPPIQSRG